MEGNLTGPFQSISWACWSCHQWGESRQVKTRISNRVRCAMAAWNPHNKIVPSVFAQAPGLVDKGNCKGLLSSTWLCVMQYSGGKPAQQISCLAEVAENQRNIRWKRNLEVSVCLLEAGLCSTLDLVSHGVGSAGLDNLQGWRFSHFPEYLFQCCTISCGKAFPDALSEYPTNLEKQHLTEQWLEPREVMYESG